MFDPKTLIDQLLGTQTPGGGTVRDRAGQAVQMAKDNPLAAGALAAVLLGTKPGRKLAGGAIKIGGLAAVAGLAYKAYQNYQNGQPPASGTPAGEPELLPPPADTPFDPAAAPQGEAQFALAVVRAMIAAARADGHIDDAERSRIGDRLGASGLDQEAEAFLVEQLRMPVDVDALVASAQTEAQRVEIYTASRLAIEPKTRAERGYLDMLAGRLNLPDALVDHIEATVTEAKV